MKKAFLISRQTSLAKVHHWQIQFRRQTTVSGDTSTGGNFSCLSTFKQYFSLALFFFFFFFFLIFSLQQKKGLGSGTDKHRE
jgi:hypothetical protein